jgi:16S rRNA G966 N2-methylase RsmD
VFIESDKPALQCLRDNIEKLGLKESVRILAEPAEAARPTPASANGFGLICLDPPYRLSEDVTPTSIMGRVISNLGATISVTTDALTLWRHDAALMLPAPLPGGWVSIERRVWGTMAITLLACP